MIITIFLLHNNLLFPTYIGTGVWGGVSVPTLHFLLHKRRIDNIRLTNRADRRQISGLAELLCVCIPHLHNIEPALWANRNPIHRVGRIGRKSAQHGCNAIIQINIRGILFLAPKRVATTANVMMALPQWRRRITHQEEHAIGKGVRLERIHDRPELLPGLHGTQINESVKRPFCFLRRMKVKRPGARRNHRGKHSGGFVRGHDLIVEVANIFRLLVSIFTLLNF